MAETDDGYSLYKELNILQLEWYKKQILLLDQEHASKTNLDNYPLQESNIWIAAVCNALYQQPVQQAVESADYIVKSFKERFGLINSPNK